MKAHIASFLLVMIIVAVSCDKIKVPNQKPPAVYNCIDTNNSVTKTNAGLNTFRKVLVEDYTGHRCPNCPRAAETAEALMAQYGSSVVVIANHVSTTFAKPVNDSLYKEDFRNPASNDWDTRLNMSNSGLPKGGVNRTTPYAQNYSAWTSLVASALAKPQTVKLDLKTVYSKTNSYLDVTVKTTFLQNRSDTTNLVILLTQDSIVSDQSDNQPPAGATMDPTDPIRRLNYHFDNIVVNAINSSVGDFVKASPAANDTVVIKNTCYLAQKCFYTGIKPKVCLNNKYLNVVAFIYNVSTLEVLQVEKLRIQ